MQTRKNRNLNRRKNYAQTRVNNFNKRQPYTSEEVRRINEHTIPDRQLSKIIGRSAEAIQIKRVRDK